jgi:hypothetical protein
MYSFLGSVYYCLDFDISYCRKITVLKVALHGPLTFLKTTVNLRPTRGISPSKAARLVNLRWTNLTLYGIDGDVGTWPWKVKIKKQKNYKYIVMIFIYEQTVYYNKV